MKNFSTMFFWGLVSFILFLPFNSYSQWVKTNYPPNRLAVQLTVLNNNLFCAADTVGTYYTDDNGNTWTLPENDNGTNIFGIANIVEKGGCLYAGTNGMGIYCTNNNAVTWQQKNTGLPDYPAITALHVNNNRIFTGVLFKGIYVSDDDGANWAASNTGLPASAWILSLFSNGDNIYAGVFGKGIYYSSDNGANWTAVNNGFAANVNVYDFASIGNNVYAAVFPGGLFVTNDNGSNWNKINSIFSVYEIFTSENRLFITGTDNTMSCALVMSADSGNTWTDIKAGLPDTLAKVSSITICKDQMYAVVKDYHNFVEHSEGVWRRPVSELITSVTSNNNIVPAKYNLLQNYPNPFNPSTTIPYVLPEQCLVTLKIYDMLGREVKTLVNSEQAIGQYMVNFDASGLASGTYLCRLSANGFVQTMKMSVLK